MVVGRMKIHELSISRAKTTAGPKLKDQLVKTRRLREK
jgi:hypothetical protein